MARGRRLKNPNGYGSVVKLSGKRRKPYEVRVNTRMDERNYPTYDVLGRFEDRMEALSALVKYHEKPYDINRRILTFSGLYEKWFKDKYEYGAKQYSTNTIKCTKAAYLKCSNLYNRNYRDLKADDFRDILSTTVNGKRYSHAMQEHLKNLFNQLDRFALENDVIEKSYSSFAKITVADDDEHGVPFTKKELALLWKHKDMEHVDTILILCYSGWRISEIMNLKEINLEQWYFKGGNKTAAGKDRLVPIHTAIREMVQKLFLSTGKVIPANNLAAYYDAFSKTLTSLGIQKHTPHDCRHTFTSLLDSSNANSVCIERLVGHASKGITKKIYTHKDMEELRDAVESIKVPFH